MTFDKNQSTFSSAFRREVWWWAIGIVPLADSLTDEVIKKCSPDVLEGCRQWHAYFNALCEDMDGHCDVYLSASARQYRDILEKIAADGQPRGDAMVFSAGGWEAYRDKLNRSKAYVAAGIDLRHCLTALERTGLTCERTADSVVFGQTEYPKIFHAMRTMELSPDIRNTPARHHFAHCEYRQLFKSYSANYDELLRRASDESLFVARAIHDYCKSLRIQRYIHFGIIKYKYKGIRVLDFNLHGDEYPTLRINMGTCASADADVGKDEYYRVLTGQNRDIQAAFLKHLVKCDDPGHKRYPVVLDGREEWICPCSKLRINPFNTDVDAILAFISARKASIDRYCGSAAPS
jgi:hypothetical protein